MNELKKLAILENVVRNDINKIKEINIYKI